jgi:type I restriction enzyme S subunit
VSAELPLGWALTSLPEISNSMDGQRVPLNRAERARRAGSIPYYGASGIIDHVDDFLFDGSYLLIGEDGANLLSRTKPIAFQAHGKFWVNNHAHILKPLGGIPAAYLEHYFNHIDLSRSVTGTAQPKLTQAALSRITLPLPPFNEQKRIVAKIEELTTRSRRAKEALGAVPPLLDKLRQSILAAAFRGDLTADWRAKNPNVEPADQLLARSELLATRVTLPYGWRWAQVADLAAPIPRAIQSGPFGSALKHSEFSDEGPLVIGIDNVQMGKFSLGRENRISATKFRALQKFEARAGDVLITVMATVGRCAVVPDEIEPSIISKHVYRVSCNRKLVIPKFLMWALMGSSAVLEQLGANIRGQTRAGINGEILRQVEVPLPPIDEQQSCIDAIESLLTVVERFRDDTLPFLESKLSELDQSILAKAFRGDLVPQDPTDEPASVLLDRIRATREATPPPKPRRARKASAEAPAPPPKQPRQQKPTPEPTQLTLELTLELTPSTLETEVFPALWPRGPLDKDTAVRTLAEHLRTKNLVEFTRLRADGPLYAQLLAAIEAAAKSGELDRPRRGHVRAIKLDATAYAPDDWRQVLLASLGHDPTHQEDAVRQAAEWARDNLGLEFTRLRADGHIATGLRSAITSAIRQGLVERDGPRRIRLARG